MNQVNPQFVHLTSSLPSSDKEKDENVVTIKVSDIIRVRENNQKKAKSVK